MTRRLVCGALCALLCAACSSPGGSPMGTPDAPSAAGPDAQGTATRLVQSSWTIDPGTEFYQCERLTVDHDIYITKIKPIEPLGTHHTLLNFVQNPTLPDGTSRCSTFDPNWIILFASGVGSPDLTMPAGVALKIPAGTQIVLNLHLFNATDNALQGTSGYDVWEVDPSDVQSIADVALVGPIQFAVDGDTSVTAVPPDGQDHTVQGHCTMQQDTDFFAVFPHMHEIGKHIKIWVQKANSADQVVYDADYDFNNQRFATFPSIHLTPGDQVWVTCTFNNPTLNPDGTTNTRSVGFGDSTTDEMCFAISDLTPPFQGGSISNICYN